MRSLLSRAAVLFVAAATPLAAQAGRNAPSVAVTITRQRGGSAGREVLLLRVEGRGLTLGAYQGHVYFDPAVMVVDSVVAGTDGARFVNAALVGKGEIRYGGFTPTGFKNSDALRIVAHASRPLEAAKVRATLEVAGDIEGKALPKAGLIGSTRLEMEK